MEVVKRGQTEGRVSQQDWPLQTVGEIKKLSMPSSCFARATGWVMLTLTELERSGGKTDLEIKSVRSLPMLSLRCS